MTVNTRPLRTSQYANNAETTAYTAGAGARVILDKFTAYNSDATSQTLTVKLVPSGATATPEHVIVVKALAIGETYTFPEVVGHTLESGGSISLLASVSSKISVRISGREVT